GNIGGGTFALTGGLQFPGLEVKNYSLDFAAIDLNINSDFYKGILNANFNVTEAQYFRKTLPKLSGQVNLDKCRVSVPSLPDSDDPLPEIILDVSLNLGEKVHFYSSRLYDMYLTGNVSFEGTTLHPKTSGAINVKRGGTLTYLESVFNIREGEAHFNQIGTFFPTLHFAAETKIDRTKIFLAVDGSPDNMKFSLTSSPEMSETEILRLLTLHESASSGGEVSLSSADALAIGLQMTILGSIEDALKQTLGIDQFTVSRGSGSMFGGRQSGEQGNSDRERDYNVKIGKYINDKLMIRYTRGFGSHKVNRYGLQYDFNDNIGLTVEREGSHYIFSIEARYKF
ncbi:MAG: translocation/assembly module TamB domain-containing protein, partial [Selenomonadaceae bacterium]|nr:translocation/assembly module TamB domain-containing protein [Selenomonadaceae bacterium]